ncbi:MAG: hypothetical protein H6799_00220 [Candidatus Nomurabacteria bacterium]|nr:MAG: hypothetical protein H6799_00220 [Candidatus Nomurabacteria bacterium]HRV76023.1 hypothetical protein [Candidatus Saccharimonadales bacterium]
MTKSGEARGFTESIDEECWGKCPEIGVCVQRAVVTHVAQGISLNNAFFKYFQDAREAGLIPESCKGPVDARLSKTTPRERKGISRIEGAGGQVVGIDPWGNVTVRVCQGRFDS